MPEDWLRAASRPVPRIRIDAGEPNVARVWNFLAGGRDNFAADRRAADQILAVAPGIERAALASQAFGRRAVGYLAGPGGIRQFLDIGTGLPAAGGTHEIAQAIDPACRVAYVDNDPVVLAHARAQLRSATGGVAFLDADARRPAEVIAAAAAALDFTAPVAVIAIDILNFLERADDIVADLVTALPPGSYLVLTQPVQDAALAIAARRWNRLSSVPVFLRDRAAVARWCGGLTLVEPGIVAIDRWRPAADDPDPDDPAPGDRAPGDRADGDRAADDRAPGDRAVGDRAPGDRAVGDRAPGDRAVGGNLPLLGAVARKP